MKLEMVNFDPSKKSKEYGNAPTLRLLIINIFVQYFSLIIVACTTRTYTRNLHAQGNRRSKGAARRVRRSARSAVAVVRTRGEARALLEVNAMPRRRGTNESCFVVVVVIIIIVIIIYYLLFIIIIICCDDIYILLLIY